MSRYLDEIFSTSSERTRPDTLVLGCTHFPVLAQVIAGVLGPGVVIVDSAETTAHSLASVLATRGLARQSTAPGTVRLLATDGAERFARVGGVFLGRALTAADVEIVDLPFTTAGAVAAASSG